MADGIKQQFAELERERLALQNRIRVRAEKKAWDERKVTGLVLRELKTIQDSCSHPDKKYLGVNIAGDKWFKCNDCDKLVVEEDYSGL